MREPKSAAFEFEEFDFGHGFRGVMRVFGVAFGAKKHGVIRGRDSRFLNEQMFRAALLKKFWRYIGAA